MAPERGLALEGVLLGTALGDALALPMEGMRAGVIARRFGQVDRFRLIGATGFVSDDTEQAALIAQSLLRARGDDGEIDTRRCERSFRRSLVGWFLRAPFGVGMATIKACLRALIGLQRSGVHSAGNGAAMRAGVLGVALRDRPELRIELGRRLAEVSHVDPRAVEGALFVAELAALCSLNQPDALADALVKQALGVVEQDELRSAITTARVLAANRAELADAAAELKVTGFVLHSLPLACFCWLRWGDRPLLALQHVILAGGDTDTTGAMVGAWCGAQLGPAGLPLALVERIHDGPFGPTHLRALARALDGEGAVPSYSWPAAWLRNLLLWPVILAHGFRRLLPF